MKKTQFPRRETRVLPFWWTFLVGVMIFIALIPLVYAWEFDNVKSYDKQNKRITIKNAFGLGKELAEVTLIDNTDYCLINCEANIKLDLKTDYKNPFKKLEFFDIKNNMKRKKINNYQILIKTAGEWKPYDKNEDLSEGTYYIKIKGKKAGYESIEWIPTNFMGVKINEWAIWASSFESNIMAYYNFSSVTDQVAGNYDLVNSSGNPTFLNDPAYCRSTFGGCGNLTAPTGDDDAWNITNSVSDFALNTTNFTISFWINQTSGADVNLQRVITKSDNSWAIIVYEPDAAAGVEIRTRGFTTNELKGDTNFTEGEWNHILITANDTTIQMWLNGSLINWSTNGTIKGTDINVNVGGDAAAGVNNGEWEGFIDELAFWNRSLTTAEILDLWDSGTGTIRDSMIDINVTLNSPADDLTTAEKTIEFNCSASITAGLAVMHNLSLLHNDSGVEEINQTIDVSATEPTSINTTFNVTFGLSREITWNCRGVNNNSEETEAPTDRVLNLVNFIENSHTFNDTSFETKSETFILNITTNGTTPSAELFYNGTNEGNGTVDAQAGNSFIISQEIDISTTPLNYLNKSFYWQMIIGGTFGNTTTQNQTINATMLGLCNATQTAAYINFTFVNETTGLESVNATAVSSWVYYLGSGLVNKTLSFTNATENPSYAFCLSPGFPTLSTIIELDYDNTASQQRTYIATSILTNTTANIVLYLLPTTAGLFQTFQTITTAGDPIALVSATISRVLGGSTVTIASDFTDDSGVAVFFLNPDATHTGLFQLSGFADNEFTFVPTTTLRIVTMGGGGIPIGNGTQIASNTTYQIFPVNSSLINNTNYLFGFNVSSSQSINFISMNITNESGTQVGFSSNAGTGFISLIISTHNNSRMVGYFTIRTPTENMSIGRIWIVGVEFIGEYSIFNQLSLFIDYDFSDFIRLIIVLAVIIGVLIFMSAGEITDTSESKVIVATLLVWGFSLVGWLDTGLVVSSTSDNINTLAEFSSQYGIAILTTLIATFFIFRRLFIRRI